MPIGSRTTNQRLLNATRRWECVNYLEYLNKKRPNRRKPKLASKGNATLKNAQLTLSLTDMFESASGFLSRALESDTAKHIERVLREVATG